MRRRYISLMRSGIAIAHDWCRRKPRTEHTGCEDIHFDIDLDRLYQEHCKPTAGFCRPTTCPWLHARRRSLHILVKTVAIQGTVHKERRRGRRKHQMATRQSGWAGKRASSLGTHEIENKGGNRLELQHGRPIIIHSGKKY